MLPCPKVAAGETEGAIEGKRKSGWLDGPTTPAKQLRMVDRQASVGESTPSKWTREDIARLLAEADIVRQSANALTDEAENSLDRRLVTVVLSRLHYGDSDWSEMTPSEQGATVDSLLRTLR